MLCFVSVDMLAQVLQAASKMAGLIDREAEHSVRRGDAKRRDEQDTRRQQYGVLLESVQAITIYIRREAEILRVARLLGQTSGSAQSSVVVGMVRDLFDILDVLDSVLFVEHENRAALDPEVLDQSAVVFAKRTGAMVGQHFDLVHTVRATPAFLRKRQIHADGVNFDTGKFGRFFIEALSLCVADRGIE